MSSKIADKSANFIKVEELIEKNFSKSTDIIILPEVWTAGWKCSEFKNSAERIDDSKTIKFLSKIAKKYNTNIIGGSFITQKDDKYYNTCPIINRNGELIATYDKMHLFSYYGCNEGIYVEKGKKPVMVEFDFNSRELTSHLSPLTSPNNRIKLGLTLCYDIRFPEIYRTYAQQGADLLINVAAWPMSRAVHWEMLTRARAIENQCFMVALTQSGLIEENEWNLGHSRIIDYNGEIKTEIDNGEGAMYAEIRFDDMYEFRKKCTVLKDIHENYKVKE